MGTQTINWLCKMARIDLGSKCPTASQLRQSAHRTSMDSVPVACSWHHMWEHVPMHVSGRCYPAWRPMS